MSDDASLSDVAFRFLADVVAIDSASDERSASVPSTEGQRKLAQWLERTWRSLGADVEIDRFANVLARLPGRGALSDAPPLALMVHLDTARGTEATDRLAVTRAWDGQRVPYAAAPGLRVDVQTYPALAAWVGQDLVHGAGVAPFGLDDKLGLTHLLSLAWLLRAHPERPSAPVLLVARPDEEIGRDEALVELAATLATAGVRTAWTVDGLDPFEVNTANFEAAWAGVWFPLAASSEGRRRTFRLDGVNTHGATAHVEGHRPATRLMAEVLRTVRARGGADRVRLDGFVSTAERDCDAWVGVRLTDDGADALLDAALDEVLAPHRERGAGVAAGRPDLASDGAAEAVIAFVDRFLASDPGFVLSAEDSHGWTGYSHPFRVVDDREGGGLRLDIRLRDFDRAMLERRKDHVRRLVGSRPHRIADQYHNMAPRLRDRPDLVERPRRAAAALGRGIVEAPVRGGTGVDPFLDAGVGVANLGTGYFAPESEKEFTSLQQLVDHARWLHALVTMA